MFEFDEARRFLSGELEDVLTVSYPGTDTSFRVERRPGNTAEAFIPASRGNYNGDSFDIAMALGHPACGVKFELHDNEYQVQVSTKHQLYAVLKIALNHLGWHDDQKVTKKYKSQTASA
jgi:hypothetical protein